MRYVDVARSYGRAEEFLAVQSTWNVLEPSAGTALAEAAAAGAQVIVKEPVANGRLASNVAATGPTLDGELLAELDGVAEDPGAYWAARSARAWS